MKEETAWTPKTIGILGFEGVMALDITGPLDAFDSARVERGGQSLRAYHIVVVGPGGRPFKTESGLTIVPHLPLEKAPLFDTLIIPGGCGLREAEVQAAVLPWLKARARHSRRIATICTGIYGLAETGLLDGRTVATHWKFASDVARRYPALKVDGAPLFVKDGKYYTSAGVTAGIDLALALIEEDYGAAAALTVARELVVFLKRSGSQDQYSEPLKLQVESNDRFSELLAWILGNLDQDLSVEALASRACLSPRHFSRLFRSAFGESPAIYIENLRLAEARRRLTSTPAGIDHLAASVGYSSPDSFRRSFARKVGVNPSLYRHRFGGENSRNNRGRPIIAH